MSSLIEAESKPEPFHMDLHSWLDAQQTSHGVRHDDYAQYHAYCTRRLARLANKPKEAKALLKHSGKYATPNPNKAKTPGGRHAFCGRTHDTLALTKEVEVVEEEGSGEDEPMKQVIPNPVPHVNILWHLLVSSERSWAHANEIRKKGTRKKRQSVLKKLKRANQWAILLVEKAKLSADSETQTECEAYQAWMSANYAMEQMKYQVSSTFCCSLGSLYGKRLATNTILQTITLCVDSLPIFIHLDCERKLRPCYDLVPPIEWRGRCFRYSQCPRWRI